jgi:TRAP-type uncharacterized transport system fused permease subunit
MSLYHMWATAMAPPEALIFRGSHLLFALVLVYLLYPVAVRPDGQRRWWGIDALLILASMAVVGHIFITYQQITNRIIYIDDLTLTDQVMAVLAVLLVLDATRRVIGWALPITAMLFVGYALFGTNIKLQVLLEQLYLTTEGIFGSTLGVSATYVIVFVLFGASWSVGHRAAVHGLRAVADRAHRRRAGQGGGGQLQPVRHHLGQRGRQRHGRRADHHPADEAHRLQAPFAAGVESTASTGGQIMPPIMGAAAFVMAEYLAVSYFQVTLWALIPALLFYVAVFAAVHFEAKRAASSACRAPSCRAWSG